MDLKFCSHPFQTFKFFLSRLFLEKKNNGPCATGASSLCFLPYVSTNFPSLSFLPIAAFIPEFAEVLPAWWKIAKAVLSSSQPSHSKTFLLGPAKGHLCYAFSLEVHHNWSDAVNHLSCPIFFAVRGIPWQWMGAESSQYASWTTFLQACVNTDSSEPPSFGMVI